MQPCPREFARSLILSKWSDALRCRYFTHMYEKALQECGYTGSMMYWDWTLSSADPFNAPIFSDKVGIGGDGVQSQSCTYLSGQPQQCVATGPFAMLRPAYFGSRFEPHSLVRCFTCGVSATMYNDTWTAEVVNNVQKATGYAKYGQELYMGPHLNIHEAIGGDFPQTTSPNEPLFFLHHTQVDRLWWKWQQADLEYRLHQYEGTNVDNSVNTLAKVSDTMHVLGLAMDVPVAEVMNTEGGMLCYRYAN
ncbi:monooxygenase [Amylocarpus encephaloides]|uniref:Monooxygenase n=1 Tax=Amylocarpus encephaloides TaxID=45428 RepID=A0A9P8C2W8_9HELO|nr:monooxygenase [Amylocarpus encephaloides]